jgi:hypothetical protein
VILGHHMGEELLPTLLAGGATAGSVFLALVRARLSGLRGALRRRPGARRAKTSSIG